MHKLRKLIALLGVVAISSTLVVSTATAAEWYEPYMQNLVDVGVDFGDPGSNTTRCEWASGVVAWNGLEADTPAEPTFLDVPKTHECYDMIETAYAHGVLSGYSDSEGDPTGYFGPDDPITREQAAKMIVEGEDLPVIEDSGIFPDESGFSQWALDEWYHSTVYAWNKMVGDSDTGMFRPGENINHAEAAKVITIEAELSASYVEEEVPEDVVSEGDLLIELSDESPEGDTVPSQATSVEVAAWDFTAQDGDVVLDSVKVHTHGVTSLPNGHSVYLYQGNDRLTSGKSVNSSTNLANFSNLDLLIEDGETVTLTLRIDVGDAGTTSREMGFEIEEAEHVDASDATVTGDFPLQGDTFGISTTDAGTLTIEKNGTIVNPKVGEDDVVIAKFKMSAATEAAEVEQVGLLVTGTISNDAVENLELYVQGETDPIATVDGLNSNDIANFVLDTPYVISKGDTKAFTMKADFNTGRTDDTVKVYVDETTDVVAIGGTYGFGMAVSITDSYDAVTNACTSSAGDCSYSALEGGDITVTSAGPTATDVATAADDVHLLDFSIVSVSDVTFKNFPVGFITSDDSADTTEGMLDSTDGSANLTDLKVINVDTGETLLGPIDSDALQQTMGGTAINETAFGDDDVQMYYLFTDEFDMESGEELNLAITTDIANTATLDAMTIVASLQLGSSYPEIRDLNNKIITNSSSLVPASAITGKTMTIAAPSLTIGLAAVPVAGENTVIKGEKDVKFTGFTAACGNASGCKVTDVLLQGYIDDSGTADDWTTDGIGDDNATYLNAYVGSVWLEDSEGEILAAAQSVESDGDVQFNNMEWEIDAGDTPVFYAVGDISGDAYKDNDGENVAFGVETAGDVDYEDDDGNAKDSTGTPNSEGTADTDPSTYVTINESGSLALSEEGSPSAAIVVAGEDDVLVSKYKFDATNEAFRINDLELFLNTYGDTTYTTTETTYQRAIDKVTVKYPNSDGDTVTKTGSLSAGTVTFSSMDMYVEKDSSAYLEIYVDLNTIQNGAVTQDQVAVIINENTTAADNDFEAVGVGSGTTVQSDSTDLTMPTNTANVKTHFLRETQPVISKNVSSSNLINGTNTLYGVKFTNDYDESVSLRSIVFKLSGAFSNADDGLATFKMYRGSTNISDEVTIELLVATDGGATVDDDMETIAQADFVDAGKSFDYTIQVEFNDSATYRETIAAGSSETYYLKATAGGINSSSDSVSTYIPADTNRLQRTGAVLDTTKFKYIDGAAGGSEAGADGIVYDLYGDDVANDGGNCTNYADDITLGGTVSDCGTVGAITITSLKWVDDDAGVEAAADKVIYDPAADTVANDGDTCTDAAGDDIAVYDVVADCGSLGSVTTTNLNLEVDAGSPDAITYDPDAEDEFPVDDAACTDTTGNNMPLGGSAAADCEMTTSIGGTDTIALRTVYGLIWSDNSSTSSSTKTPDWSNGYLLNELDSEIHTLSY